MRVSSLATAALAVGVGCAPRRPPATSETAMRVDTVTAAVPVSAEQIARVRATGTRADTIVVEPLRVELRVGQVFAPWTLKLRPLDATGAPVPEFIPAFIFRDSAVLRATPSGIQALAPGETAIYVEALPRGAAEPRPRPSTELRVVVTP